MGFTGQEILDVVTGGQKPIVKPGDVYVLSVAVPSDLSGPITSTATVISSAAFSPDTPDAERVFLGMEAVVNQHKAQHDDESAQ